MTARLSRRILRALLVLLAAAATASCDNPPQVYGSVGFSSFNGGGYHRGGPGFGTSVTVGGRIF
ncbi:MAG: hypothetical protein QNI96_12115 [Woeseiaceae bacterium]|nr:hypothetical protein [Woeseiaceae bacterium]